MIESLFKKCDKMVGEVERLIETLSKTGHSQIKVSISSIEFLYVTYALTSSQALFTAILISSVPTTSTFLFSNE